MILPEQYRWTFDKRVWVILIQSICYYTLIGAAQKIWPEICQVIPPGGS